MRRPKLSETQKQLLMIAYTREKRMRHRHFLYGDIKSIALGRIRETILVLSARRLVIIGPSPSETGMYYWLSDAGELLARALLELKTQKIITSSRTR